MDDKKTRKYQLELAGVLREYTYPNLETVEPDIKRMKLISAIRDIRAGRPVEEIFRDYIANGLEVLVLNSQSDLNGGKKLKVEPFPTARRRSDPYLAQSIFMLSEIMSVGAIAYLGSKSHDHPELGVPELTIDTIKNYREEYKKIHNRGGAWHSQLELGINEMLGAFHERKIYYFTLPRNPIEKVDFRDEIVWSRVTKRIKGRGGSS
jgi:hypothetical protein